MAASSSSDAYDDFETDEWSPDKGSFLNHAIAGSLAGVAEHSVMFPVDTIKTMITGKERITVKEVSKMESIVFEQEQQGHKIERVEALERYLFGTCRPSHS